MRFRRRVWLVLLATIASLTMAIAYASDTANALEKVKTEGSLIYYRGTIVVSGAYSMDTEDQFLRGDVCFSPKGTTAKLIPRENDFRSPWFCFSNNNDALRLLHIPAVPPKGYCKYDGTATIQISNYIVDKTESEVSDFAQIEKVLSFEKPTAKKCEPSQKFP